MEVSDLSGRLVRLLHDDSDTIGTYEKSWDGRDDNENVVPPGVYVFSVEIDSDREEIREMGLLYVAY